MTEETIARAYMRLQCADVPRGPWHWEVSQMLQPYLPAEPSLSRGMEEFKIVLNELEPTDPTPPRVTCVHGYTRCMPCKFPPDVAAV